MPNYDFCIYFLNWQCRKPISLSAKQRPYRRKHCTSPERARVPSPASCVGISWGRPHPPSHRELGSHTESPTTTPISDFSAGNAQVIILGVQQALYCRHHCTPTKLACVSPPASSASISWLRPRTPSLGEPVGHKFWLRSRVNASLHPL